MEFSGIGIGAIDIGVLLSYYGMAYYKATSEKDKDLSLLLLDGMKVIGRYFPVSGKICQCMELLRQHKHKQIRIISL